MNRGGILLRKFIWLFLCFFIPVFGRNVFAFQDIGYDIKFSFNEGSNSFLCKERVVFSSGMPLDEVHFHFYPAHKWSDKEISDYKKYARYFNIENPFPSGFQQNSGKILSVKLNGRPVGFSLSGEDNTILVVCPIKPVSGKVSIDIEFEFNVPNRIGRFGEEKQVYSIYRAYPILDVMENGKWLDYPDYLLYQPYISESARYSVEINIPRDYALASSGQMKSVKSVSGRKVFYIKSDILLRDFSFFISPKYKRLVKLHKGVEINVFYLPSASRGSAERIAGYIADALDFYERHGFEYPYKRISVVAMYLGYGGNETSNAVMLDRRVFFLPDEAKRYQEFLVVHEFGHQFWFNQVGSDEFAEPFMDEAVNSYFLQLYFKEKYSDPCKVIEWPRWLRPVLPNFTFTDGATVRYRALAVRGIDFPLMMETRRLKQPDMVFAFAYGKGEAVLEAIERAVTRERFLSGFRAYFTANRFKIASLTDLVNAIADESSCPEKVRYLFNIGLKPKRIDLFVEKRGKRVYRLRDKFHTVSKAEVKALRNGRYVTEEAVCGEDINADYIEADPNNEFIETNEVNNRSDFSRAVSLKLRPLNLSFYSMDIFNPQDRITFRLGADFTDLGPGLKASLHYPFLWDMGAGFYVDTANKERSLSWALKRFAVFGDIWDLEIEYAYLDDYSVYDENSKEFRVVFSMPLEPYSFKLGDITDSLSVYFAANREWFSPIQGMFDKAIEQMYYDILDISYLGISIQKSFMQDFVKITANMESGMDILGSDVSFNRALVETALRGRDGDSEYGVRFKIGLSDADGKPLFFLGGSHGLRAFRRKAVTGSNMALFSVEGFVPVWKADDSLVSQNPYLSADFVKAGCFFDGGAVWSDSLSGVRMRKDIGAGLRIGLNIAGLVSSAVLRVDIARSLGEEKEQTRVFVGFGSAF